MASTSSPSKPIETNMRLICEGYAPHDPQSPMSVVEINPGIRTIAIQTIFETQFVRMKFPTTIFIVRSIKLDHPPYGEHYAAANPTVLGTTEPIRNLNQPLYSFPLPNSFLDGEVCLGADRVLAESQERLIEKIVDHYFTTPFNQFQVRFNDQLHPGVFPTAIINNPEILLQPLPILSNLKLTDYLKIEQSYLKD